MAQMLKFSKLDFRTVTPYFTKMTLLILVAVIILSQIFIRDGSPVSFNVIAIFAYIYCQYPFAGSEKSGMDALYRVMDISRKTVVYGRYFFALAFLFLSFLVAVIISVAFSVVLGNSMNLSAELLKNTVMFYVFSILIFVQFPAFFKLGYMKAKGFIYIPIILVTIIVFFIQTKSFLFPMATWIYSHTFLTALIAVVVWIALLSLSYRISLRGYKRREF